MSERKYFETSVEELEKLVEENLRRRQVLGEIRDELTYRSSARARQLLKEVTGILAGDIPLPQEPPRESRPQDQIDLLED